MAATPPVKYLRLYLKALAIDENGRPIDGPAPLDLQLEGQAHLPQTIKVVENGGTATFTTGSATNMDAPKAIVGYSTQPVRWNLNNDMATPADEPISQWLFLVNEDGSDLNVDSIVITNDQAADDNNNDAYVTIYVFGDLP